MTIYDHSVITFWLCKFDAWEQRAVGGGDVSDVCRVFTEWYASFSPQHSRSKLVWLAGISRLIPNIRAFQLHCIVWRAFSLSCAIMLYELAMASCFDWFCWPDLALLFSNGIAPHQKLLYDCNRGVERSFMSARACLVTNPPMVELESSICEPHFMLSGHDVHFCSNICSFSAKWVEFLGFYPQIRFLYVFFFLYSKFCDCDHACWYLVFMI